MERHDSAVSTSVWVDFIPCRVAIVLEYMDGLLFGRMPSIFHVNGRKGGAFILVVLRENRHGGTMRSAMGIAAHDLVRKPEVLRSPINTRRSER